MLRRVERRAQLAARPWPRLWISARFRVILAQGVAASMSMQPLKTGSRGNGSTSRKQKSGKAIIIGAGALGMLTMQAIRDGENYDVCAVVDTQKEHVGLLIDGVPVYGLETLDALL